MTKRIGSIILALCMMLTLLAGCGQKAGSETEATTAAGEKQSEQSKETTAAESRGPVEISYLSYDAGRIVKEDNPVVKAFEDKLNIKLKIELLPGAEFGNKLNILVASGDLPDLINIEQYNFMNYVNQGVFMELNELINKHGSNIKKYVPQEAWDRVEVKGKYYSIPSANYTGKYTHIIRKDWLDTLGLSIPKTTEDFYTALKAIKEKDPSIGKTKPYGFGSNDEVSKDRTSFMPFFGAFGGQYDYTQLVDGKAITFDISENYREALRYIKKLYDEKLIDPEALIQKVAQAQEKVVQSKVASVSGWWSLAPVLFPVKMKMTEISPEAQFANIAPIQGPDGKSGMRANPLVNNTVSINKNAKNPEAIIKFLDYLISDEGTWLAYLGIEGQHWEVKDGKKVRTPEGEKGWAEKWLDVLHLTVFRADIVMPHSSETEPAKAEYIEAANDATLYYDLFEGFSTEDSRTYGPEVSKFATEAFVRFVSGDWSLDKEWDSYVKQWKEKGGEQMRQSLLKVYNEMKGTNIEFGN